MILKIDTDIIFKREPPRRTAMRIDLTQRERLEIAKMAALAGLTKSRYLRLLHKAVVAAYKEKGRWLILPPGSKE